jgi:hypothetical protein
VAPRTLYFYFYYFWPRIGPTCIRHGHEKELARCQGEGVLIASSALPVCASGGGGGQTAACRCRHVWNLERRLDRVCNTSAKPTIAEFGGVYGAPPPTVVALCWYRYTPGNSTSTVHHGLAMSSQPTDKPNPPAWCTRTSSVLTALAHGSAPFITTFLFVHLAAPITANLGGSATSSRTMVSFT